MRVNLSKSIQISELCWLFHISRPTCDKSIWNIVTNSKEVTEGSLFIALRGKEQDGHCYIQDAIKRGATAILCEEYSEKNIPTHIAVLQVENTVWALGKLASYYKKNLHAKTIAITGSVGKTTTRFLLEQMLRKKYIVHATKDNENNELGVPLTILSAPLNTEILLLEMGMNHKGEIHRLSVIAKPDTAIITTVGHAHIGHLGSVDDIIRAKLEIADGMNGGDLFLPDDISCNLSNSHVRTWTLGTRDTANYRLDTNNLAINFPQGNAIFLNEKFTPYPFARAALSASAICDKLHFSREEIGEYLACCSFPCGRLTEDRHRGILYVDDAYNASPESMREALLFTSSKKGEKHAVLGDMLELGHMTESAHFAIGKLLSSLSFSHIWLVGEYADFIKNGAVHYGMPAHKISITTKEKALFDLKDTLTEGCILLVKGSHKNELSLFLKELQKEMEKELS